MQRTQSGNELRDEQCLCVQCNDFVLSAVTLTGTPHTCKQKQDRVVSAVGSLDSLDSQVAVLMLSRHHGQTSSNWPNTVVCQEIFFDKAQGVV